MSESAASEASRTVVVDLGKKKRKQVGKLHKGEGALMEKLGDVIAELRSGGQIRENADTIIVVVEKKTRKPFRFPK